MFLVIKGVQQVAAERRRDANLSDFFTNAIFRDIVISTSATLGLYTIASVIHVRVGGPTFLLRLIEGACSRADGSVAYGHFACTVHTNCAVLYKHLERLRRILSSFFPHPSRTNPPPMVAPSLPMSSRSRTRFVVPLSNDS